MDKSKIKSEAWSSEKRRLGCKGKWTPLREIMQSLISREVGRSSKYVRSLKNVRPWQSDIWLSVMRPSITKKSSSTNMKTPRNEWHQSNLNVIVSKKITQRCRRLCAKFSSQSLTFRQITTNLMLSAASLRMRSRNSSLSNKRKRLVGRRREQTWMRSYKTCWCTTKKSRMNVWKRCWSTRTNIKTTSRKWS